jgi:hypothetical protein
MLKDSTREIMKFRKGNALRVARELFGYSFPLYDLDIKGSKARRHVAGVLRSENNYVRRHGLRHRQHDFN